MGYYLGATFSSPESSELFGFSDFISEDDWSVYDYWVDISSHTERLIELGERTLKLVFPLGHSFTLCELNIKKIGDDDK